MTLSALVIALSMNLSAFAYSPAGLPVGNEAQVQACVQQCLAWSDAPGAELRACVAKCQDLVSR